MGSSGQVKVKIEVKLRSIGVKSGSSGGQFKIKLGQIWGQFEVKIKVKWGQIGVRRRSNSGQNEGQMGSKL